MWAGIVAARPWGLEVCSDRGRSRGSQAWSVRREKALEASNVGAVGMRAAGRVLLAGATKSHRHGTGFCDAARRGRVGGNKPREL